MSVHGRCRGSGAGAARRGGGVRPLTILHDVSLEVGANEVVVVLGANGAGKTTLFRAIAGLLAPRSGTIELFGQRSPAGRRIS